MFLSSLRSLYLLKNVKKICVKLRQKLPRSSQIFFSLVILLLLLSTLFENHPKCLIFQNSGFSKNSSKLTIFYIFDKLLSTQNVNVAKILNETFSVIFKHCVVEAVATASMQCNVMQFYPFLFSLYC